MTYASYRPKRSASEVWRRYLHLIQRQSGIIHCTIFLSRMPTNVLSNWNPSMPIFFSVGGVANFTAFRMASFRGTYGKQLDSCYNSSFIQCLWNVRPHWGRSGPCYKYATPKESFVLPWVVISIHIKSLLQRSCPLNIQLPTKSLHLNEVKTSEVRQCCAISP